MIKLTFVFEVVVIFLLSAILIYGIEPYMKTNPQTGYSLKEDTKESLNRSLEKIPNYIGVVVLAVDLPSNTRRIVYLRMIDPVIKVSYDEFFSKRSISEREPLFVRNGDAINLRIIKLINHEFTCTPYSSIIGSRYVSSVDSRIGSVCGIAIPPSYGEFDGMMNIYLSKEPTAEEKDSIKVILKSIAEDIYPEIKPLH